MIFGNQTAEQRRTFLLGFTLVVGTLALYWPATSHDFILLDDGQYVTDNPHVVSGLSLANVKWAFTSAYASNWHPLTWISHMLDCSIFGLFAGGHHLTNVLLHAANTLLLFFALKRLTQSALPSFVVAALFAWHPAHVESVAWVAERKDVLSTFFLMLTLLAYACYVNEFKVQGSKFKVWYRLALICFALGLMSKPMLVTLPCVLLLLDYWPLKRIEDSKPAIKRLFIEKIPFFALAFAACISTLVAQHAGGAIQSVAEVPLRLRILNSLTAYLHYVEKAFWPVKLSIYYLLPAHVPIVPAICSAAIMIAITVAAFVWRVRWPWVLTGWLWYVGTLVPVIGLVQVGSQAMADRYTYIPFVGLFIAVVWSVEQIFRNAPNGKTIATALATASLLACVTLTHLQLNYWHNSISLFQHATEVTPNNYFAEYELGTALADAGRIDDAIIHHTASLRINPSYEPAHFHIGLELATVGKLDDAAFHFSEALKRDPTSQELHNNLGTVLAQQNKLDAAVAQFQQAIQINPQYGRAYLNCALTQERLSQFGLAFTNFTKARELEPDSLLTMARFASFLATCPDLRWRNALAALQLAENASNLTQRQNPLCLSTLAVSFAANGNFSNAVATAELARDKAKEQRLSDWVKKLESDLVSYRAGQVPPVDWQQAQQ